MCGLRYLSVCLFDQYDPDGSGVMTLDELQKMLRKAPTAPVTGAWGKAAKGMGAANKFKALTKK